MDSAHARMIPIRDHACIGDGHTAALVSKAGSIDWCCMPRFDSPSVFAAILDRRHGGHFAIRPQGAFDSSQRYVGMSNILETRFQTAESVWLLQDFMPAWSAAAPEVGSDAPQSPITAARAIVRRVRCLSGSGTMLVDYAPKPLYAESSPTLQLQGGDIVCEAEGLRFELQSPAPMRIVGPNATQALQMQAGEEVAFLFRCRGEGIPDLAGDVDVRRLLQVTRSFWEDEASQCAYEGPWRDAVVRSFLVLRMLTYAPTGRMVAAPTTSLPERLHGTRNWDYRYAWVRDTAFEVRAMLSLERSREAERFFDRLVEACADDASCLRVLHSVDGTPIGRERELPHLRGYGDSRPVRIGNAAMSQRQNDVFGEVMASAAELEHASIAPDHWNLLEAVANRTMEEWMQPDHGIWEVRGKPRHFVYSKMMCWVALARAIEMFEHAKRKGPIEEWRRAARRIRDEILECGWNEGKQSFVQAYGSDSVDAASLLIPIRGFLPYEDPRVVSTVERVQRELGHGPFLHRYLPRETDDGFDEGEGAFVLCGFWAVQCLAQMGRKREAQRLYQELIERSNHVGLFSEMIDPASNMLLGNFPQAFSHVGVILAAQECLEP